MADSSTMSISGIGSGFNVQSTVESLMSVEAQSQNLLKRQLTKHQTMVSAYQQLNTTFASIKQTAGELAFGLNWRTMKATSSGDGVTATAGTGAVSGSFSFSVQQLAKRNSVATAGTVSSLDTVVGNSGAYAGKTLSQVVEEVNKNSSTLGYSAAAIQVAPGSYKLQLQATQSGTAGAIAGDLTQITASMGAFNTVQAAQDAILQVGSGAGAYSITSSSNTVKDALPGVTLNLTKADPNTEITVNVAGDADAMADKVGKLVDSLNSAAKLIQDNSKYDPGSKSGGVFLGNSTTRTLSSNLHQAVTDLVGSSLKLATNVGISFNSDGTYSFDKAKFKSAYNENPEAVASLFVEGGSTAVTTGTQPGIAERLQKVANAATDSVSGWITTALKGENTRVEDLNKTIASWDDRLEQRRATLTKMFNAMDSAVSGFNSQSNWLAGQLSSMTGS